MHATDLDLLSGSSLTSQAEDSWQLPSIQPGIVAMLNNLMT